MREYLVALTDHIIANNHFVEKKSSFRNHRSFFSHIKIELEHGDVSKMDPETLGKIMASFEIGDILISKYHLFSSLHFSGDCEELLREQVSFFLACVIVDRLLPSTVTDHIPPYNKKGGKKRMRKTGE